MDTIENKQTKPVLDKIKLKDESVGDDQSVVIGEIEDVDQFVPLTGLEPYDGRKLLTVRSVLSGTILGSLVSCANLYLGLKTGFGADATLFSAIFGYGICKLLEKSKIPYLSDPFGPHENNIIQAVSLGCIGVGFMFVSGVPAMYQLNLLGGNAQSDYGRLVAFTVVAGFWGLGYVVPLRSLFVLQLARQLGLSFPIGSAAAVTIRALHSATDGSRQAHDNIVTISWSFSVSLVWSVATSYAPGILYQWNPFWWIYKWGGTSIMSAINWGWLTWQWSPSLIGMGMMIELNAALSYLLGSFLSWVVIGPILIATGAAVGVPSDPEYPAMITYNALIPDQFDTTPSPRYWILWPGIFVMLATSMTTILFEYRSFGKFATLTWRQLRLKIKGRSQNDSMATRDEDDGIPDPVPREYRVRWWEWSSVSLGALAISLGALKYLFDIPPALNLLSLLLGFLWSFVAIQIYGVSGVLASGVIAKGTQFITGGILRSDVDTRGFVPAARINLVTTSVSAAAMQQSAELTQDFRTGFLLGTPSRAQWYAQMTGTISSVFLAPGVYILFAKAYPCIQDASSANCTFAMPAVTSWLVVSEAIMAKRFPITQSSWIFSLILSMAGIASVALKRWLCTRPRFSGWARWVPNFSLVGLAMTTPGSSTSLTMAIGSVSAYLWAKTWPKSHARCFYPLAAGGVAGEGIGYVVQSILQIAEVGGPPNYGTGIGCVANSC